MMASKKLKLKIANLLVQSPLLTLVNHEDVPCGTKPEKCNLKYLVIKTGAGEIRESANCFNSGR